MKKELTDKHFEAIGYECHVRSLKGLGFVNFEDMKNGEFGDFLKICFKHLEYNRIFIEGYFCCTDQQNINDGC